MRKESPFVDQARWYLELELGLGSELREVVEWRVHNDGHSKTMAALALGAARLEALRRVSVRVCQDNALTWHQRAANAVGLKA